jgi:hypothetical protein
MKNFRVITVTLLLLSVNFVFGQKFQQGSVVYQNGETRNGFVVVPKKFSDKTVKFKSQESGTEEKISSADLKMLTVKSEDNRTFVFERLPAALKVGLKERTGWLLALAQGYACLYMVGDYYATDKKGNVLPVDEYVVGRDLPTVSFYIKKGKENTAYYFGLTSKSPTMFGMNNVLKKNAKIYLSECPQVIEKIEKGDFTHKDIEKAIELYNQLMKPKGKK